MKIYSLKKIETPRLILRPVQLGDEFELNKSVNNTLSLLQKWQPWADDPSLSVTRDFVQRGVFAWESNYIVNFPMVVIHKCDNKIIGASGYNEHSNLADEIYEIGYWLDLDYQGQGLVTEYVNALTRYTLLELKAKKVNIIAQIENIKSINVAKRLNFVNDSTRPNHYKKGREDYVFSRSNCNNLSDLEVAWNYNTEPNHDAEIISWAKNTINIKDDKIFEKSKSIIKTPWSNVIEINTGAESVYLKETPKDLFLEAEIIKLLRDKCNIKTIPKIIADNEELNCFLMTKCGDISLRNYFDGKLQVDILEQSILTYKDLQKATILYVDELISLGVPDWRLDKFSILYQQLISNAQYLTENRLNSEQQKQLHQYKNKVKMLCEELARFEISETLNHSDFHDNNILYDKFTKTTAIIDLGETAVNHPLFSLRACLGATKYRYNLTEDSSDYKILKECAFSNCLADKSRLTRATEIINILFPVYLLFTQKRFLDAINLPYRADDPISAKQHDKINKAFVCFIGNMENTYGK